MRNGNENGSYKRKGKERKYLRKRKEKGKEKKVGKGSIEGEWIMKGKMKAEEDE